jgi:D-3-phosphoglycerate dehydrogenase
MMKMKILVTAPDYFDEETIGALKNIGEVVCDKFTNEELLEQINDTDILIIRSETKVDRTLIDRAKNLKIVATGTRGVEHIDTDYAKQKGIKIISLSDENSNATAEHTIALMLSLIRKVPWSFESVKSHGWERGKFIGHELKGKTLGLIGLGNIGKIVAKIAKSFGMNILVYDPYVDEKTVMEYGTNSKTLENLLENSDIISVHVPLTKETAGMISYEQFKMMKKRPLLINTARGKIIDSDALVDALKNRLISGAALDVLPEEPPPAHDALIEYVKSNDNLLITPHLGGLTKEAICATGKCIVEKIKETVSSIS